MLLRISKIKTFARASKARTCDEADPTTGTPKKGGTRFKGFLVALDLISPGLYRQFD
jgi:hypothetical protein